MVTKYKSLGESIVRTDFNPEKNSLVDQIKQKHAELINLVETINSITNPVEASRLCGESLRHLEISSMFAVKAATVG